MTPLLATPWDGLLPVTHKKPLLTLVHNAKTTFVGGVSPFETVDLPPMPRLTLTELLAAQDFGTALPHGAVYKQARVEALAHVAANPGVTTRETAKALQAPGSLISSVMGDLAKRKDVDRIGLTRGRGTHYTYYPKGTAPAFPPPVEVRTKEACQHKAPKKAGRPGELSTELVHKLRQQRAAGARWNELVCQYRVGRKTLYDAVRGTGAYKGV